ncbi:MAG: hypothetical protein P8X79_01990 [Reinekea sp.]
MESRIQDRLKVGKHSPCVRCLGTRHNNDLAGAGIKKLHIGGLPRITLKF